MKKKMQSTFSLTKIESVGFDIKLVVDCLDDLKGIKGKFEYMLNAKESADNTYYLLNKLLSTFPDRNQNITATELGKLINLDSSETITPEYSDLMNILLSLKLNTTQQICWILDDWLEDISIYIGEIDNVFLPIWNQYYTLPENKQESNHNINYFLSENMLLWYGKKEQLEHLLNKWIEIELLVRPDNINTYYANFLNAKRKPIVYEKPEKIFLKSHDSELVFSIARLTTCGLIDKHHVNLILEKIFMSKKNSPIKNYDQKCAKANPKRKDLLLSIIKKVKVPDCL